VPSEPDNGFRDRFVLDTGRIDPPAKDPEKVTFTIHGEYQLRFRAMSDVPLTPPVSSPGHDSLGQTKYVYHWLRLTPRFQYRDTLAIVGQIDLPRGMVVGDTTTDVAAVRDSMTEERWYDVHPRYLYLEYVSPIGVFRVGQQGSFWGMGILANDGDHPTIFGDYQRGALTERVLFATTPLGKGTPLTVALAGDLVFEDNTADLLDNDLDDEGENERPGGRRHEGDRAFQGVAAIAWRTKAYDLGVYGVVRHQERDAQSVDELTPFIEDLTVGVLDVAGKFNARVPGADAYLYGALEAATIFGSTSFVRSGYAAVLDPREEREDEKIRSFGTAVRLGAVHMSGEGKGRFGDLVVELEWGYASGDADPYDGTTRRFTMDPNHNVGLVLFDQVLAWKTARAATIAQDPSLVNRPSPGVQLLPSKGGVFGATYLNPRAVVRPLPWIDLKGGVLIAQTTADFVDPYHYGALGNVANYDGGDARRHDLGLELDLGADARIAVDDAMNVQAGVDFGALLPGHAFDDEDGEGMANQYLVNAKVGLQF
jgi:hypothetical protein